MKSTILQLAARILMLTATSVSASIRYVDVNSVNPTPPYTNWAAAAMTIQDAVDAAVAGDQILVTNGVYQAGERMAAGSTNRLAVDKPVIVRSVNGAAVTIIRGEQLPAAANVDSAIRCVYLTNGAALAGFTLTNGMALYGGGVWCDSSSATVSNCVLTGNFAGDGGGASGGTLYNCTLTSNSAHWVGGGAFGCTLYNCTLTANSAREFGGGALNCVLNTCTLAGNSARWSGGGAEASTLTNCILYYNRGGDQNEDNYHGSSLGYSCTTPLPEDGIGNLTNAPLFVDYASGNLHLQANSPCINSGANAFMPTGPDLDGNPRLVGGTVDMGAYEFQSPIRYVDVNSAGPAPPYANWATAAATIQDAVDAAIAGDQILVTNGVYKIGGRVIDPQSNTANRVAVTKAVVVRSVNSAGVTVIQGTGDPNVQPLRCVYLVSGASLEGFTLTAGSAASGGGGVWCESSNAIVSNCVLTGNLAGAGGGACGGTLKNCSLTGNSASFLGGGAFQSTLYNCMLSGNSTRDFFPGGGGAFDCNLNNCTITRNSSLYGGGGVLEGTLNNCIVYYNNSSDESNYSGVTSFNYSCTTPLPTNGIRNLTNAPLFVDYTGGNLRLQSDSPCINSGANALAPAGPDLDGSPRTAGETVDMGAYEFPSPRSLISYAWLQQYGLPTDGSADTSDADGDGWTNGQEWHTGTDPTSAASALRLLRPSLTAAGMSVSWQSVIGRNYLLERSTDLGAQPPFAPLEIGIVGQPGTTSFTDTNAVGGTTSFYRVWVQE